MLKTHATSVIRMNRSRVRLQAGYTVNGYVDGSLRTLRRGREVLELVNRESEQGTEKRAVVMTTLDCCMGSFGIISAVRRSVMLVGNNWLVRL